MAIKHHMAITRHPEVFIKPDPNRGPVEWSPPGARHNASFLLQFARPIVHDAYPGTMWHETSGVFGGPPQNVAELKTHLREPHAVYLHPRFVEGVPGEGPVLHHVHISPTENLKSVSEQGYVLGNERRFGGAKVVEAYPLTERGEHLMADTGQYVFLNGRRDALIKRLYASAPELPPPKPKGFFGRLIEKWVG
jgi:hypothetical protein